MAGLAGVDGRGQGVCSTSRSRRTSRKTQMIYWSSPPARKHGEQHRGRPSRLGDGAAPRLEKSSDLTAAQSMTGRCTSAAAGVDRDGTLFVTQGDSLTRKEEEGQAYDSLIGKLVRITRTVRSRGQPLPRQAGRPW